MTGRVRVATHTLRRWSTPYETRSTSRPLEVSRISVDRMLLPGEAVPQIRTEGDVTVIPLMEEVLVVGEAPRPQGRAARSPSR